MPSAVTLHTERLILRPWRESDREPFAAMGADPEVMEFFPALLSRRESDVFVARIEQHFADHGYGPWAVEERASGSFVGFVGIFHTNFEAHFTPCVEVAWRLMRSAWGKGYASEAARESVRYAFQDLGLQQVVSFTSVGNLPSQRVMRRIGMRHDAPGDFQHPRVEAGHPLRPHVLYRLDREASK
jgi:RimJ/RimL family protein N-acetyltransferase